MLMKLQVSKHYYLTTLPNPSSLFATQAITQGKCIVQPDAVADNLWWEAVLVV